jgi:hypothetical protein
LSDSSRIERLMDKHRALLLVMNQGWHTATLQAEPYVSNCSAAPPITYLRQHRH